MNFVCGVIDPGAARTWPRSTSSRPVPRSSAPMLSPASPESNNLRNISTPVQTVFVVSRIPTISISSPTLINPRAGCLTCHNRATSRNRKHIFNRHQEWHDLSRVPAAGMYSSTAVHQLLDRLNARFSRRRLPTRPAPSPSQLGMSSPGKS